MMMNGARFYALFMCNRFTLFCHYFRFYVLAVQGILLKLYFVAIAGPASPAGLSF